VNLPLGVAAFAVIARTFHAQRSEKKPVIATAAPRCSPAA
jgi:hypothetical protein